jgi:hypothetical protein
MRLNPDLFETAVEPLAHLVRCCPRDNCEGPTMKTRLTLTAAAITALTACGGNNNANNVAATNVATNAATMNAGTMNAVDMNATDLNATTNTGVTDVNATGNTAGNATTNY